ncbi:hypothetical protein HF1_09260 [Mycoplasma haemofelis str. Langford 1]|uniref:Uncharacterized protein n=1 Tax=Mycoplasma haemofelis (strain Langford 1) TaxID=941640 RepID=E8ZIG3_MYCHL|nr:hypothetical protein [Mycoplasma haemofelis]CBY92934.1 hypothetical protein HF1_09260 [Mycoplasma haemofelis str. Langford 1]
MVKYLATGVPAAAGVAGLSVYLSLPSEDTVANIVKSSVSGKDYLKVLESKESEYWVKYKDLYSRFKLDKVTSDQLPNWCEETLKSKASPKNSEEIDFAKKWCVVDVRNIKEAAKGTGVVIISELEEQTTSWQDAWTHYNTHKTSKNLEITDSTFTGASGSEKVALGPALKTWCTSKESKFMYEFGGEEKVYEKYLAWCVKAS